MKSVRVQFIGVALGIFAVIVHQSFTLADDYAEEDVETFQMSTLRPLDELTAEEEALANEAREHIAKAIENNLIRLLAVVSARSDRRPRQDDEDDDSVTPNPNVLPQVAQILGAIFSGSLNITKVVDQTFGLVPNIVRNQVGGIVTLLTGTKMESSTTASATSPKAAADAAPSQTTQAPTTAAPLKITNEAVIVELPKPEPPTTQAAEPEPETTASIQQVDGANKGKYRIRTRTKGTTTTTKKPLEDDEIEKVEDDIRRLGRSYEPMMRDAPPDYLGSIFRNVIQRIDFNSSEIQSAVPSIFQGTRQAFTVLENLGLLDVNDVLDELDLPTLEEEEEEEEDD